jgi:hypothetical protein
MKKLFIIALLLVLGAQAQLSKSFRENSFVANGDGFVNQKITLQILSNDFKTNYFARFNKNVFETDSNFAVKCSGQSGLANQPIVGFEISFNEFTGPGTYDLEDISMVIYFKKDNPEPNSFVYMQGVGSLVVTSADTIGKLVEGYFSGTFTKFTYNTVTKLYDQKPIKIEIKNGKFSAVHYPVWRWNEPVSTGIEPVNFEEDSKKKKKK